MNIVLEFIDLALREHDLYQRILKQDGSITPDDHCDAAFIARAQVYNNAAIFDALGEDQSVSIEDLRALDAFEYLRYYMSAGYLDDQDALRRGENLMEAPDSTFLQGVDVQSRVEWPNEALIQIAQSEEFMRFINRKDPDLYKRLNGYAARMGEHDLWLEMSDTQRATYMTRAGGGPLGMEQAVTFTALLERARAQQTRIEGRADALAQDVRSMLGVYGLPSIVRPPLPGAAPL
jgi:hypothetical protein